MEHKKNKIIISIIFFLMILTLSACHFFEENIIPPDEIPLKNKDKPEENEFIFGITIDDTWYDDVSLSEIIKAIKKMPKKPTIRIVMSKEKNPKEYVEMFKKLNKVSFIMACPVDSYEMIDYRSVDMYKKRFQESYEALNQYVDIWEIGNEINGEGWLGENNELIKAKMISAFDLIYKLKGKTALTAYYTKPETQKTEMLDWLKKNLPKRMKKNLNYLFVSYYEDDNEGYEPAWEKIFLDLEKEFPKTKLGIGECGSTNKNASENEKIKKAKKYYSTHKLVKNYVGGYFWWYWVTDCVPHEKNRLYKSINEAITEYPKNNKYK